MADLTISVNKLLVKEGSGYIPDDNGRGPSKWGVTLRTATDEFHLPWTPQDIGDLDHLAAFGFYHDYWCPKYNIGLIADQLLADKLLDLTVNLGAATAIQTLQKSVGVHADGLLGPVTARAVNIQDPQYVLLSLREEAEALYHRRVARNPDLQKDLAGWLKRLAEA